VALHEATHHLRFSRRPERGTGFLGLLRFDQAVDDLAALNEQVVHCLIEAIDLPSELNKGRNFRKRRR
jgi:hypothetical protein